MPEAVIVDTIRTPIGRAFKGSLAQLRPDELGAFVIDELLERNPEVQPSEVEDVFCGCGMPQGLQAFNIARIMVLLSKKLPETRQRRDDVALLRLQPGLDQARRQRGARRPGRHLHRRRRRVGEPLQRADRAGRRRDQNEQASRARTGPRTPTSTWASPRSTSPSATRSAAPTWTSTRSAPRSSRSSPRRTASSTARSSRSSSLTAPR